MANRKDLKKDVDYLCDEMILDTLSCYVNQGIDGAKYTELLEQIDRLNVEFKRRIQHPGGKEDNQLVKLYYKQLREDFNAESEKIYSELKTLNIEKTEN
jgi:hypothetical protein